MPTSNPRSPRLIKGALVAYESRFLGSVPNVIAFQYNPEQLSRSLRHRQALTENDENGQGKAREETFRVQGPPIETFDLTVRLNAADQLEDPAAHPHVASFGLHPALAALEMIMYPAGAQRLMGQSFEEVAQQLPEEGSVPVTYPEEEVPLVLFVWGESRVLPVRLTSFSVTEQAFDPQLNPLRAEVDLSMRVLSPEELKDDAIGGAAYEATQLQKETLARTNLTSSAADVLGSIAG